MKRMAFRVKGRRPFGAPSVSPDFRHPVRRRRPSNSSALPCLFGLLLHEFGTAVVSIDGSGALVERIPSADQELDTALFLEELDHVLSTNGMGSLFCGR